MFDPWSQRDPLTDSLGKILVPAPHDRIAALPLLTVIISTRLALRYMREVGRHQIRGSPGCIRSCRHKRSITYCTQSPSKPPDDIVSGPECSDSRRSIVPPIAALAALGPIYLVEQWECAAVVPHSVGRSRKRLRKNACYLLKCVRRVLQQLLCPCPPQISGSELTASRAALRQRWFKLTTDMIDFLT